MRPRFKILITLVILLAVAWGVYFWFNNTKNDNEYQGRTTTTGPVDESDFADPDGDGLQNWQERLYGTSITQKDTDRDGVDDYQEVTAGTNPNFFGEGIADGEIAPQEKIFEEYQFQATNPNETSFEEIVALIQKNQQSESEIEPASVDQELKQAVNELGRVVEDSYILDGSINNAIGKLFSQEPTDRSQVIAGINVYKKAAQGTRSSGNHPKISQHTTKLSNGYESVAANLQLLLDNSNRSEFEHATYINQYTEGAYDVQEAIISIHEVVVDEGIVFEPGEPGHYFMFAL